MRTIYEPKGKAREYSPLALNIYNGCSHGCSYCYRQNIGKVSNTPIPRKNLILELRKHLENNPVNQQVLLCFMCDPYCVEEQTYRQTHQVLNLFYNYHVPTAILTKGGSQCLRDLDLFQLFGPLIKIGATLTFQEESYSIHYEPGAAMPYERLSTLSVLREQGIKTWASFEPVIDPTQSLDMLRRAVEIVPEVKIGRWNYADEANEIDWRAFGEEAIVICREAKVRFYIKNGLAKFFKPGELPPECRDADVFAIRKETVKGT